jgi:hypothetical protein
MDVYFVDSLTGSGQGLYIDYYNMDYSFHGWKPIDIGKILALRQEEFFSAIEKLHTDLSVSCACRFKWWWLLPASRLILWHPPVWKPLVFALAIAEELESLNNQEVYLVGCPVEVGEYLREFCSNLQIHDGRKIQYTFLNTLRRLLGSFKYIFEVLIYILLHRKGKLDIKESSPVVVWTYVLNSGSKQIYGKDHFFGDMFDSGSFEHPVHWVYYDSPRKALETSSSFCSGGSRSFIYDWIGLVEWLALVKFCLAEGCFRRITVIVPEFVWNGFVSKAFARNFASALIEGYIPHAEFITFLGMKNILKELSPRALVYPYEEKCMERSLLMAVRESMTATVTIGFAHAVYNKGLMFVRRRSEAAANPPSPDKLMVTGPALKKWLVDWAGWDEKRLFIAGSPRCHNMITRDSDETFRDRPLRVLILIGQGYEATVLSNQLWNNPQVFDDCEVVIRPYPYAWQAEQNAAYARMKKISKNIKASGGQLTAQLSWCDISVYCSTTAGLEAMLSGRLTVYLNMNHIFSLNPIDEKIQDSVLLRAEDLSELRSLLDRISNMTKSCYTDMIMCQNKLAGQIFQKIDHGELNSFFDIIAEKDASIISNIN